MKLKLKLKPIISMILLGLAAPAFADDAQSQLDAMKAQIAKMETIIDQNQNANIKQSQDWFNRITVSGLVNVDGFFANKTPNFKSLVTGISTSPAFPGIEGQFVPVGLAVPNGSAQSLALDNANVFVHAAVNDWVSADIDFVYQDNNYNFILRPNNSTALDEAYITIGNFARNPIFFRAGRIYEPFGMYERYPLLTNPTQLLSETSATSAQLGFVVPQGFYGSIYALRGLAKDNSSISITNSINGNTSVNGIQAGRSRIQNGGADLGYTYASDNFGTKVDVGYIYNMADVNYIAASLPAYSKAFGGVSVSGDIRFNAFDAGIRWVGATQSSRDIIGVNGGNAKPQAAGVDVGYTFPVMAHSSRIGAGYQHTWDAVLAGGTSSWITNGLPKDRLYIDYMVNTSKWTDIGVAVYQDRDYGKSDGCTTVYNQNPAQAENVCAGTGKNATVGMVRLSVKIA